MASSPARGRLTVVATAFANPSIRRVLLAFGGFSLAEWMTWIAILVYAFGRGGATETGIAALVQLVPAAVVAPLAATFGDHKRRDRALLAAYLLQAASMTLTAVALAADAPGPVVYAAAAVANTSISLTRPLQGAILPSLARAPSELTAANVASGTIEQSSMLVGPLIAGIGLAVTGPAAVFGVSAVLLLGGAALVRGAVTAPAAEPISQPAGGMRAAAVDVVAGLGMVLREPRPRAVLALIAAADVLWGALDVLLVVLALDTLRIGESGVGLLNAAVGAGGLLGAGVSLSLIGRRGLAGPIGAGVVAWGLPLALVGLVNGIVLGMLLLAVAGLGSMLLDTACRTMLQRVAPDRMLARTFGLLEGVHMASLAVGSIVASGLVVVAGQGGAFMVAGSAMLVAGALAWPAVRRLDTVGAARSQDVRLLRGIPMFAPLGPAEIDRLACALVPVHTHPDGVIVRQGDAGEHFYIVTSGRVAVSVDGQLVRHEGPGESFGEIALLRSVPRTATVQAVGATEMVVLDRRTFLEAVTGQPASAAAADALVSQRLGADEAHASA
jgi:hypothetical protein